MSILDLDDNSANAANSITIDNAYPPTATSEAALGVDVDLSGGSLSATLDVYEIKSPFQWLAFAKKCNSLTGAGGSSTACAHKIYIGADLDFATLDGTLNDISSTPGIYDTSQGLEIPGFNLIGGFTGVIHGGGHKFKNFRISYGANATIGLIADCRCTLSNFTSEVSISNSGGGYLGGIVGKVSGGEAKFTAIRVNANMTASNASASALGGILGRYDNSSGGLHTLTISEVRFSGTLQQDNRVVGGIIGETNTSNSAGSDIYITKSKVSGSISADDIRAGMIGSVGANGGAYDRIFIRESMNEASVTTTSSSRSGGFVAYRWHTGGTNIDITDSYNAGTITSATSDAAGVIAYALPSSESASQTIQRFYNIGTITSASSPRGAITTVNANATVTDVFYLDTSVSGGIGVGTSKTQAQLKAASLYSGWDTTKWNIVEGSYPTLKALQ